MYKNFVKPIFDRLFAVIILIPVTLFFFIPISLIILLFDGGPVLYKGKRLGKNETVFPMYKFRTMKNNSKIILNRDGSTFNSETDVRLTKTGKFLRETSIDELPQLLNILKGEMSFIGPRASLESAKGSFKEDEIDKMKVKPGITGLTQAYYRNSLSTREKRLKDSWYGNHVSLILDVKIFFKTVVTVFKRENIYSE